jgi:hypothetical protein
MSAWSHLPNARHIDWVIDSVKQHPECWNMSWNTPRNAAWRIEWNEVLGPVTAVIWNAARDAIWNAARDATRPGESCSLAALGVIIALIAYDDCAHLLDMSSEKLKLWALLSEQPAAVLLVPATIAREQIAQLESV